MLRNGVQSPLVSDFPRKGTDEQRSRPQILFIDAYDSFSQNIIALLESALHVDVNLIHIDNKLYNSSKAQFLRLLASHDAVVAGPGPGDPNNARDIGLISKLWDLEEENLLPVLGICLGFQSLAISCGATIKRLQEPRHGIVANIVHPGKSIFRNLANVEAVQYHSLQAYAARHDCSFGSSNTSAPRDHYGSFSTLQPLAWDMDNPKNGRVLAAMKHSEKPFWGVQYHPESICTNENGKMIVLNWWNEACSWLLIHKGKKIFSDLRASPRHNRRQQLHTLQPSMHTLQDEEDIFRDIRSLFQINTPDVCYESFPAAALSIPDICAALNCLQSQLVVLESATGSDGSPVNSETGRKSIIGTLFSESLKLHYYTAEKKLVIKNVKGTTVFARTVHDIWKLLRKLVGQTKVANGPEKSPFWGGLIGYISYEAGLETIGVSPSEATDGPQRPDICFAWITESIVIDHINSCIYVQSVGSLAPDWVKRTTQQLNDISRLLEVTKSDQINSTQQVDKIIAKYLTEAERFTPMSDNYCAKVKKCKDFICAGDSYELCLTDKSKIKASSSNDTRIPWLMYLRLRKMNPAPFQAFLDLGNLQLLGSSPERFLRWDREGVCQYRPIKGTVKKRPDLTREQAVEILSSSKERAENLMIVDLIRHDLHGVVGPGNVQVQKLMSVEEYASVYQLVSVVEGQLQADQQGIDVLAASLPPGSMTGAPKRRSCELLKVIEEQKPRGIYSGVLGYLDVGGGGDFSVVIRTAYKWNDDSALEAKTGSDNSKKHVWNIGAGGAVTAQSVDISEFEEMEAKLDSILRIFDHNVKI